MTDQSLFNKEENAPDYSSMLASIKNDNGEQKYRNVEEALKALANAQEYIPKLHQEVDALRTKNSALEESYNNQLSIAEKLDKVLQEQEATREYTSRFFEETKQDPPDDMPKESVADEEPPSAPSFNEDDLYNSFRQRMSAEETSRKEAENLKYVENNIVKMYGDKSVDFLKAKASEVGMSLNDLKDLSSRSPKAALNLLGLSSGGKREFSIGSSFNSATLKPSENNYITQSKGNLIGSNTTQVTEEFRNAGKMVDQLREHNLSINDLADPKNYFKMFK